MVRTERARAGLALGLIFVLSACVGMPTYAPQNPAVKNEMHSGRYRDAVADYSEKLFNEGRQIFRHDTFGSEAFWSGKLRLHEAIAGERFGGVGHGSSRRTR